MSEKGDSIQEFLDSERLRHERGWAERKKVEPLYDHYKKDKLPENLQRLKELAQEFIRGVPDRLFSWEDRSAYLYQALELKDDFNKWEKELVLVWVIEEERERRGILDPDELGDEILDLYDEIAEDLPPNADSEDIIKKANYRMGKYWDLEDGFDEN